MAKKVKKYIDDGWAVWIDGDDTSTVYLNYWLNPKGKSYVDVSVKILGIKETKSLNVYVPLKIEKEEIEDISLSYNDERIARATFSAGCIIDYFKNDFTSEIAYNGKTVDIVHISKTGFDSESLGAGTLISVKFDKIMPYIANEEGYFAFRIPHQTINEVFSANSTVKSSLKRVREMLTTPILTEKYGYSVRINEARMLPSEINKKGIFHRQKLKKSIVSVSVREDYEINDANCYRILRLEEALYKDFVPKGFKCEDIITYQWRETREKNLHGHYNFYFDIVRKAMSKGSLLIYMSLLIIFGALGNGLWDFVKFILKI